MYTQLFWRDALERSVATFMQTFISVTSIGLAAGTGLEAVPWVMVLSTGGLASLLSLAKSLYALELTEGNSASLTVNNIKEK